MILGTKYIVAVGVYFIFNNSDKSFSISQILIKNGIIFYCIN